MSYAVGTLVAAFLVVTFINAFKGGLDGVAAGFVPVLLLLIVFYMIAVAFGAQSRSYRLKRAASRSRTRSK